MEIVLRVGIAGIGFGQVIEDGGSVLVEFQRLGKIALRHQNLADLMIGDGKVALVAGVV